MHWIWSKCVRRGEMESCSKCVVVCFCFPIWFLKRHVVNLFCLVTIISIEISCLDKRSRFKWGRGLVLIGINPIGNIRFCFGVWIGKIDCNMCVSILLYLSHIPEMCVQNESHGNMFDSCVVSSIWCLDCRYLCTQSVYSLWNSRSTYKLIEMVQ